MITFGSILYNEENMVKGLLNNIQSYCDELKVIDQDSTDRTVALFVEYLNKHPEIHISITCVPNKKYADPDRTLLLSLPKKHDWIFMIDADERLPEDIPFDELVAKGYEGINFPMRSLYFEEGSGYEDWDYKTLLEKGKEVMEGYPDFHIRLLKKGTVWPEKVHERPTFKKELNAVDYDMLHIKTYEGQLEKAQRYAKLYPDTKQFHDNYIRYIQDQLGKERRGL